MKHKLLTVLLVITTLFTIPLQAGPTAGVLKEYRQTVEANKDNRTTKKELKKRLENNLIMAMKNILKKRFYYDQKEVLKDLNIQTLAYEKHPANKLTYFVRYKKYYVRFDFNRDPEIFSQLPAMEKFLMKKQGDDQHKLKDSGS